MQRMTESIAKELNECLCVSSGQLLGSEVTQGAEVEHNS